MDKVDAQQARRVLDRLVGYSLSPLLWDKVQRGLSAGRVQSVAVRLIVDREREIQAFVPVEYWSLHARLSAQQPPEFTATLREVAGEKAALANEAATQAVMQSLDGARFIVRSVTRGERKRNPAPPFITSTMQQDAGRKLGFSAKKTMTIAQQLYEGIESGDEGPVGLITYMRTDAVRISAEAQGEARAWATERLGTEYLPETAPTYKSRGSAQEAHEAIRPSDVNKDPRSMARFLNKDQLALYRLIWERFLASQLMPALYDTVSADITAGDCVFRAQGQTMKFKGFTAVYVESREEEDGTTDDEAESAIPILEEGETLTLHGLDPKQHFTQPPPRFTEASLIKALEELGIGRPSTYASILGTIINDRGYVHRERRTLIPTELGMTVTDRLKPFFPEIMDVEFTAQMEDSLDKVEEGQKNWVDTIRAFYEPFKIDLARAKKNMANEKKGEEIGEACPECTQPLIERRGRFGKFIACSAYPDCKYKRNLPGSERAEDQPTDDICPTCAKPMVIKHGRFGKFIACSGYPECKTTKPVTLGIACPLPGCAGQLVERRSKKGRTFYGCSAYPACNFVVWQRPIPEPCPKCGAAFTTERIGKGRSVRMCVKEGCDFKQEADLTVA
jgi:DNA topoisomerase-1